MYRVVIVEDDPMVSLINRTYVERDPRFQVVQTFQDGRAALAWLEQNPADLAVLDVYMPLFTGLELLHALRGQGVAGQLMEAAVDQIRTARKADPTNGDYRQAEAVIGARARTYQQESESRGFGGCVDPSSLCCCLMCGPALCQPFLFCL